MSNDLSMITQGWDYRPGQVTARWVDGADGVRRVQLRVDLGVLQMELEGRPDGRRPRGHVSLLDFHRQVERTSAAGARATLTAVECGELQQEAVQFHYRCMAFAALDHTEGLLRDTGHNLELIAFVRRHAPDESVTWQFIQFYPYVRMMNAQARAQSFLDLGRKNEASRLVSDTIDEIRAFAIEHGLPAGPDRMSELDSLEKFRERIMADPPVCAAQRVRNEMEAAIAAEDYERAARLRDELKRMA